MTQDSILQKLKNKYHLFQAFLANLKNGFPAEKGIKFIGVTGTDGKTTVTSMLYHVFRESGKKVDLLSTIKGTIGGSDIDTGLHITTPEPWELPEYVHKMKDKGTKFAIIESTSQGLHQNRLWGVEFDSCIITNIRYDHLDYHRTWKNYANAKFRIVKKTREKGLVVLNADDKKAAKFLKEKIVRDRNLDLEIKWASESVISKKKMTLEGIELEYNNVRFKVGLIGRHNYMNSLQVIKLSEKYLELETIKKSLASFKTPKGRMDVMQKKPFGVVIDFAHTPGSLESALKSIQEIITDQGRIITVFGCAGKRDKGRREMGSVSAKYSDVTILTAEDPRNERLIDINSEIIEHARKEKGIEVVERFLTEREFNRINYIDVKNLNTRLIKNGNKPFYTFDQDSIKSRENAIEFAINIAKKDDIVFITGKGHEASLAFGATEKEYDWSDHEVVKKVLN